jgi:peptide methionine sulfoxide reductase MsrA
VTYDPRVVSYAELLDVFWRTVDYTDARGQFCNWRKRYTSAVFVSTAAERRLAGASEAAILESGQAVATPILTGGRSYRAEEHRIRRPEPGPFPAVPQNVRS